MTKIENLIIVRNKTRLEQLTERFNTEAQAKFYITQSKKTFSLKKASKADPDLKTLEKEGEQDFLLYEAEDQQFYQSFNQLVKEVSGILKHKVIQQDFLSNYIFTENDLVIVIGQDGLVANTAKYVNNIPIVAINPDPKRYDGMLLPFTISSFMQGIKAVLSGSSNYKMVTMAEVNLNDGQKLLAFNDFFIGISSHASARYQINFKNQSENQSSSGIIVSTGAGSTGWMSSLFNMANSIHAKFNKAKKFPYTPISMDNEKLIFVVREPFLSKTSQINLTSGTIYRGEELIIESQMPQNGIIFSDGIQSDYLTFNSGSIATLKIAAEKAKLVIP